MLSFGVFFFLFGYVTPLSFASQREGTLAGPRVPEEKCSVSGVGILLFQVDGIHPHLGFMLGFATC